MDYVTFSVLKVPGGPGSTCLPPDLGAQDRTVMTIKQEINAPTGQTTIDPVFVDSTTYPGRPTPPPLLPQDDPLDNLENGRDKNNFTGISRIFFPRKLVLFNLKSDFIPVLIMNIVVIFRYRKPNGTGFQYEIICLSVYMITSNPV